MWLEEGVEKHYLLLTQLAVFWGPILGPLVSSTSSLSFLGLFQIITITWFIVSNPPEREMLARLCQGMPVGPVLSDVCIREPIRVEKCPTIKQKASIKVPLIVFKNLSPFDLLATTAKP